MNNLIKIGTIRGTHHLKGDLKVASFIEDESILVDKKVMLEDKLKNRKIMEIINVRRLNNKIITIRLKGIEKISDAKQLIDNKILLRRDLLGEESQKGNLLIDLMDLEVYTTDEKFLGKITNVMKTSAHSIYVVNEGKEEIMIPAIDNFVKKVDFKNGKIIVEIIEGMI